jgi:hypothetical protein
VTGEVVIGMPEGPVTGLLLPVEGRARVIEVAADTAPGRWRWPARWIDTVDGCRLVWCGERRNVAGLPVNKSAWALAARLGCPDLADRIGLNGDLLVAGIDGDGRAGHVSDMVVRTAQRSGLFDDELMPERALLGSVVGAVRAGQA